MMPRPPPPKPSAPGLPHQQECVPNIFVCCTSPCRHCPVHQVRNDVDKLHHSLLKHLGGVGEATDVTEPKHSNLEQHMKPEGSMRGRSRIIVK